jgi:uncharacterized protein YjiK
MGATTFRIADSIDVEISEPSDVTALPGDRFLIVSDLDRTAEVVSRGAESTRVTLLGDAGGEESCFEAVAFDSGSGRIFVVSEERHELEIFDYDGSSPVARPVARRALPVFGEKKRKKKGRNKGVEGMAWLPASLSPTGEAHILLAKEARPSTLVLLDADAGGTLREITLDPQIEEACSDFSGLAVDPKTGRLFLCSEESAAFAEIELVQRQGALHGDLVGTTELRDPAGRVMKRVEGITVDEAGNLHVLLENARKLWRFERGGASG